MPPTGGVARTTSDALAVISYLPLDTPTALAIPFLFNTPAIHRSRCGSTGSFPSPFVSFPCGLFPFQQGVYPPLPHLHRGPIPFSSFQKSLRHWRFDPVKGSVFILHVSRVTDHRSPLPGLIALCERTKCAFSRTKFFSCHTLRISWGEGGVAWSF
jgi:hypothetical protein